MAQRIQFLACRSMNRIEQLKGETPLNLDALGSPGPWKGVQASDVSGSDAMFVAFGDHVRLHRRGAGMTQEELAERAGLSVRNIRGIEAGAHHVPRQETLGLLAEALMFEPAQRIELERLARSLRPRPPQQPRSNLPIQSTAFIGRRQELRDVEAMLDGNRLVTLVGVGGVGKTRLAMQIAELLGNRFPDGAWISELAAIAESSLVAEAIALSLGLRGNETMPLEPALHEFLRERSLLLVLDNCEHLVAACANLCAALMGASPKLCILATSREPLKIPGEALYRVESLPVTDPKTVTPETLTAGDSFKLFVDRAERRVPSFSTDGGTIPTVAAICEAVEGLPLAIELAAGWIGSLGLEEILVRLEDHLRFLVAGPRTAPQKHQTLEACLDWSFQLLGAEEKLLLGRLSVFRGGWTAESAEAVCGGGAIHREAVVTLLAALIDKSSSLSLCRRPTLLGGGGHL
jgi:predicted ATPase/DNA-binding XRE family transcriptional regulator